MVVITIPRVVLAGMLLPNTVTGYVDVFLNFIHVASTALAHRRSSGGTPN